MPDLTTWLLEQITEDENSARDMGFHTGECHSFTWSEDCNCSGSARVLDECAAKRAIIDRYAYLADHGSTGDMGWVLPMLAAPYADRPGYQEATTSQGEGR